MHQPVRKAPKRGYDTEPKQAYRQKVWQTLKESSKLIENTGDRILIMPSHEGIEIDVAIEAGIPAGHIICVDQSAAVIASSLWRKKHPSVEFMTCDVGDAPEKAASRGLRIVSANLDLCGNFSDAMVKTVAKFWAHVRSLPAFYLGLTVAKGREGTAISYLINQQGAGDYGDARLNAMLTAAGVTKDARLECMVSDTYISGRVPMAWCVVRYDNQELRQQKYFEGRRQLTEASWLRGGKSPNIAQGLAAVETLNALGDERDVFDRLCNDERAALFYDMLTSGYTPPEERDFLYAFEVQCTGISPISFSAAAWHRYVYLNRNAAPHSRCGGLSKEDIVLLMENEALRSIFLYSCVSNLERNYACSSQSEPDFYMDRKSFIKRLSLQQKAQWFHGSWREMLPFPPMDG